MAQSSIHVIVALASTELHNRRQVKLEYVREDLADQNESWEDKSVSQAQKEVEILYTEKTKQKLHAAMKPIREGVINLNAEHTMADVKFCCKEIERAFGLEIFQIHIHRDEGHWSDKKNKTGEWTPNLHAQVLIKWQNQATGKSFRPKKQDLSRLQDVVAQSLNMVRGKSSSKKHETALQFKLSKLEEEIEEANRKYIELNEKLKLGLSFYNDSIRDSDKLLVKNFLGVVDKEASKQRILDALAAVGSINSRLEANLKIEADKNKAFAQEVDKLKREVSPNIEKIKALSEQVKQQETTNKNLWINLGIEEKKHKTLQEAVSRIGYHMLDYQNDTIYSQVRQVKFVAGRTKGLVHEDYFEQHLQQVKELILAQERAQQKPKFRGPSM